MDIDNVDNAYQVRENKKIKYYYSFAFLPILETGFQSPKHWYPLSVDCALVCLLLIMWMCKHWLLIRLIWISCL